MVECCILVNSRCNRHPVKYAFPVLSVSSKQGDKAILQLLKQFGAQIEINKTGNGLCDITVLPSKLHGIEIDAANIPDLVPILSLAAATAEGTTVIHGAARLRLKESDRLQSVSEVLEILGAEIRQTDDGLIIKGRRNYSGYPLKGGSVNSSNDHRMRNDCRNRRYGFSGSSDNRTGRSSK